MNIEQLEAMTYRGGIKSYKICSFTNRNNINLEYLFECGVHVVLPSSSVDVCRIIFIADTNMNLICTFLSFQSVTKLFYSLVKAMHETNSVAIARKIFCNNYSPKMVALFPCIDVPDEPWVLQNTFLIYEYFPSMFMQLYLKYIFSFTCSVW